LVSWPFLGVVAGVLAIAVLVEPHTLARRATTVSAVAALVLLLHTVSRRGNPTLASWMLVIGLSVIVTQRAWITGGIHAPVAVFYLLFIVMAGALLGARGGYVTAMVCFVGGIVLTFGEAMDMLARRPGAGSPLGAFVFVVLAIGLGLVVSALIALRTNSQRLGTDAVQMFVHDMRSPIHVVVAHLELLRVGAKDATLQNIEGALGGATTINRMTSNLLDVSRFEAGRMPVKRVPTDIGTLAHDTVQAFRILQAERELMVVTRGDTTCDCDPDLTRRILENLVGNAIKHTPEAGRVVVAISRTPEKIRIAVHDEGPGISVERRSKIFEPFHTDQMRTSSGFESSGLGLAFCRLAAEAQGGSINVEDGFGGGSVFMVELPV
jgi:signal transduction histidine kinase